MFRFVRQDYVQLVQARFLSIYADIVPIVAQTEGHCHSLPQAELPSFRESSNPPQAGVGQREPICYGGSGQRPFSPDESHSPRIRTTDYGGYSYPRPSLQHSRISRSEQDRFRHPGHFDPGPSNEEVQRKHG